MGVCVSSRGQRPRTLPQDGDLPLLGNLRFCTRCFPSHQLRNSVEFLKQMLMDPRALQGHSCCQGVPCSEAVPCSPTASGSCTGNPGAVQGIWELYRARSPGPPGEVAVVTAVPRPPAVRCPQLLGLHCSVLISAQ